MRSHCLAVLFPLAIIPSAHGLSLDIPIPPPPTPTSAFHLGTATSPNGPALTVNGQSLLHDGKPFIGVMGEFHYARYAPEEWREELLKMKAGGISVVSTYVFWIYHEEKEGVWDWSGAKDLHKFAETCKEVGLPLIVRIGPWDHGEVRNGGFPDWLLTKGLKLRSTDPAFLAEVKPLYEQVAAQLKGLLYKDGGPVIGVQVDNEFRGPAQYLLTLKKLAQDQGIDVPLYTRTGWPNLTSPMPFGEILPLFGAYAEGFWDKELTPMPGAYWQAFTFGKERTDTAVGTDVLGARQRIDEANVQSYPYLTCELGGGMMTSYHRRIHVDPCDAYTIEIAKVGSGSNLPGFYMYHGGTNPDAADPSITLQETQSTRMTNNNDMPVKTYDFQAPLGEFGQVRESYHLLRRTQMFLADFGNLLAPMPAIFPSAHQANKNDTSTLRWSVRSDGHSGFVFINNYQRGVDMPAKPDVQFTLKMADGTATVPAAPFTAPANAAFFLPFNLKIGPVTIASATVQPMCEVSDGDVTTAVFAEIPGVTPALTFSPDSPAPQPPTDGTTGTYGHTTVFKAGGKIVNIVVTSDEASLHFWRGSLGEKERIIFSNNNVVSVGDSLTLSSAESTSFSAAIFPPATSVTATKNGNVGLAGKANGFFSEVAMMCPTGVPVAVTFEQIKQAGTPREIKIKPKGNALEPSDADFSDAAAYRIKLPADTDASRDLLLRLHYVGDVARLTLDGKFLTDNFYNGTSFDLGLKRFGPDIYKKNLMLYILPLKKGAPIYIQKEDTPDFGDKESVCDLKSAEVVETHQLELTVK